LIYTFKSNEKLRAKSVILKNFITVIKLFFLLYAAFAISILQNIEILNSIEKLEFKIEYII